MNEKTIRKINRLGHFSQVVALIMKIIVIIMLLVMAVATIFCFGVSDDTLNATLTSNADISIDFSFTGKTLSASDQQALLSGKGDISSSLFGGGSGQSIGDIVKSQGGKIEYKKVTDHFINAVISDVDPKTYTMTDVRYMMLAALVKIALFLIMLFVASSLCKALRYCRSPFEKGVIRRLRGFGFTLLLWSIAAGFSQVVLDYATAKGFDSGVQVNPGWLFMALIVLALTRIFKYGAQLQGDAVVLSDEEYEYDMEEDYETPAAEDSDISYAGQDAGESVSADGPEEAAYTPDEDVIMADASFGEEPVRADEAVVEEASGYAPDDQDIPDVDDVYEALKIDENSGQ